MCYCGMRHWNRSLLLPTMYNCYFICTSRSALREMPIVVKTEDPKSHHYALPTSFFKLVLGKQLKYSCSLFSDKSLTLEDAKKAMLDIEQLPKYKFRRISDMRKPNEEIQESTSGIMTKCDAYTPIEQIVPSEDVLSLGFLLLCFWILAGRLMLC